MKLFSPAFALFFALVRFAAGQNWAPLVSPEVHADRRVTFRPAAP